MSLYAGAILFPVGTLIYSAVGGAKICRLCNSSVSFAKLKQATPAGLKAGLTSSYIHTVIIMASHLWQSIAI